MPQLLHHPTFSNNFLIKLREKKNFKIYILLPLCEKIKSSRAAEVGRCLGRQVHSKNKEEMKKEGRTAEGRQGGWKEGKKEGRSWGEEENKRE